VRSADPSADWRRSAVNVVSYISAESELILMKCLNLRHKCFVCDRPGPQINNTRIVSSFTFYYCYYYSSLFMSNCQLSRMSDQRDLSQKDTVTTSLADVERPLWNVRSRPQL